MTELEHVDTLAVSKRKSMQEDDTAKKKVKAVNTSDDDEDPGSNFSAASDVQNSVSKVADSSLENNCTAVSADTSHGEVPTPQLSKRQLKKQMKKEQYKANLAVRRAKEKEKQKQRKREARLNNVALGPSRKELKRSTMATSSCPVRVAVDMSFDHLMSEKDLGKCVKQLLRCYSANRRARNPLQLYVTSFDGKTKDAMAKHTGYNNWDVYFRAESYLDLFDLKDVVYLTSESENVLHQVEDDKAYIIGGLVDHNSQKGLTLEIAKEKGLNHAQLPIESYLEMKTRKVLSVVHVFEILLYVSEGTSWKDALLRVMPARKGAAEKSAADAPRDESEDCSSQDADHSRNPGDTPDTSPPDARASTVTPAESSSEHIATQPGV